MAGSVEEYDEKSEFDFLKKDAALPKAGATEFKVDGEGIPAVNLEEELTKEARDDVAVPLRDLDGAEGELPEPATPPAAVPKEVPEAVVPAPAPERSKEGTFFSKSETTAVEMDRALIDKYGVEWLDWEPETIWQTIRMDWNTQISRINMDKIMAAKLLHVSDEFWRHWEVFHKVVCAFNNVTPLFDRVQDVSIAQIIHALNQASEIRKEEFQDEVLYYIANEAKQEGLVWLPSPVDVAQAQLDELNPNDVADLKVEVRERWEALEGSDLSKMEFQEDVYGVHLAKLAATELYLSQVAAPEESVG